MTTTLFLLLLLVVVLGAVAAFVLSTRAVVGRIMERHGTMPPTMIGAVSILFGLFVGFSSAEITARGGALRLATQREVSAARSMAGKWRTSGLWMLSSARWRWSCFLPRYSWSLLHLSS